jgi:hypothetical protein
MCSPVTSRSTLNCAQPDEPRSSSRPQGGDHGFAATRVGGPGRRPIGVKELAEGHQGHMNAELPDGRSGDTIDRELRSGGGGCLTTLLAQGDNRSLRGITGVGVTKW